MPDLETLKIKIEAESASVNAKLNALSRTVKKLQENSAPLSASAYKASKGLKSMGAGASSATSSFKSLKGTLGAVRTSTVALVAATVKLGHGLGSCVQESMDFVETMNLFNVSMGDNAIAAGEFAEKVQQAMGIDMAEWMRNQGVFQTLIEGFGVASEKADIMSQQVTQLGYDLSSLFNLPFAVSMQKLQSGIAGELEPLRRLGFDLSQAKLQQIAYDHGIQQSIQTMTQAQKVQLRYYAIMTQVTTAHGDMARTITQPANMLRIFKQNVVIASRSIGNLLIPVMQKFLSVAIVVARGIATVANAIASLLGIDSTDWRNFVDDLDYSGDTFDDISDGIDDVGDSSGRATKKMKEFKKQFLGFDKINNITLPDPYTGSSGGGGGGAGGGGDWDLPLPTYDFLQGIEDAFAQAHPRIQQLFEDLAKDFEEGGGNAGRILGNALRDALIEIKWDEVKEAGNTAASKVADGINDFIETPGLFATIGTTLAQSLNTVFGTAKTFADEFHWDSLGKAVSSTINAFFEDWDLKLTADAIASWTAGFLDAATSAVKNVEWEKVGKAITTFLSDLVVNIPELAVKVGKLAVTVAQATGDFFTGFSKGIFEGEMKLLASIKLPGQENVETALDFIWQVVTGKKDAEFPIKLKMFDSNSEAWAKLFLWLQKVVIAGSTGGFTAAMKVLLEGPGVTVAELFGSEKKEVKKDAKLNIKEGVTDLRVGPMLDKGDITKDGKVNAKQGTIDPTIGKVLGTDSIEKDANVSTSLTKKGWETITKFVMSGTKNNSIDAGVTLTSWKKGDKFSSNMPMTASYNKWTKSKDFHSNVTGLTASYDKWSKSKDFHNGVTGLTATYSKWLKDKNFNNGVTGLTANYRYWSKANKFSNSVTGLTASFKYKTKDSDFNSVIGDMTAKIRYKDYSSKFSTTLSGMTAEITDYKWKAGKINFAGEAQPQPKANGGIYKNGRWSSITAAAGGGAFSTGQMFIAREAGPELVGRIGRSTAVMNNNQIVSSVAAGVASANAQQNSILSQILSAVQSGDAQVILQVDSTKLGEASIRSINKVQRMNGRVMLTV